MGITRTAIQQNRVTGAAVLSVALAGVLTYFQLPQAKDPGFLVRVARIVTVFPGASPRRVEELVTKQIENAVQSIPELDSITSTSKAGVSIVLVRVKEKYTHLREIWDNMRRKVSDIRHTLPSGIIGPNINDEFGETFGIVLGITGEGIDNRQLQEMAEEVRDEILLIEEVAKVELLGTQEERIFVEYNNSRLAQVGMSPAQLRVILQRRNIIIPGGDISTGVEQLVLEPSGNFESVDELKKTVVQLPGRRQLTYLEDIVDITRGFVDPPKNEMRVDGVSSLGLAISLRQGSNIVALGQKVAALLERLPESYPHGVDFHVIHFEPSDVQQQVRSFVINVLASIGIVMVIMLLFLGVRTGLVVATLIPTTILATLMLMGFLDIGLDQVSLAAMIIALGMLVDNAIVMTESILVKMEAGEPVIEAAVASTKELRISLLTSSLTTCAAFLPIFLAESTVGEYTSSIFKVVSLALLSSWVLAMTMTPLMAVLFLRVKKKRKRAAGRGEFGSFFYRFYRFVLIHLLKARFLTVLGVIVVLVLSMRAFRTLPKRFFPPQEISQITATFRLPPGTVLSFTQGIITELEEYIERDLLVNDTRTEGISNWGSFIGKGAPRYVIGYRPEPPAPEYAFMLINTTSLAASHDVMAKLDAFAFERYPDLEIDLRIPANGPPVPNPIEIRVQGTDIDRIFAIVDQVKNRLRDIPGTKEISDDWGRQTKKLFIDVSQTRAFRAGVTNQDIAVSLLANFTGVQTSEYREDDKIIPITMRSTARDRDDIGKLETLNIYSQATGKSVPLKQVADARIMWEPSQLRRHNRVTTVSVIAQLEPSVTATSVIEKLQPWLDAEKPKWGVGYRYEIGGEIETSGRANNSIRAKAPIAGFLILMLLIMQFNSIRCTFIILFTIPLALIGVSFGLVTMGSYNGFFTLLGIVSLFGIVINNAIVLIERIRFEIAEGVAPALAIVEAAQRRARPILLTTATTVGGLFPLWLSGGKMWEPMAISIIFGLLFSTILTLGVIPALYSICYRIKFKGFVYELAGATSSQIQPVAAPVAPEREPSQLPADSSVTAVTARVPDRRGLPPQRLTQPRIELSSQLDNERPSQPLMERPSFLPLPAPGAVERPSFLPLPTPGPVERASQLGLPEPGPVERASQLGLPEPGPVERASQLGLPTSGPGERPSQPTIPVPGPTERASQPKGRRPAQPGTQRPSQSRMRRPSRPIIMRPSQPNIQPPGQPGGRRPSQPNIQRPKPPRGQRPSQPNIRRPSQPVIQRPTQLNIQRPNQPGVRRPGQPNVQRPSKPGAPQPGQPGMRRPSQPNIKHPGQGPGDDTIDE